MGGKLEGFLRKMKVVFLLLENKKAKVYIFYFSDEFLTAF